MVKGVKLFLLSVFFVLIAGAMVDFSSAEIEGVTLGIPKNVTTLPDHEFSIFVEVLNEGTITKNITINLVSEELDLDEKKKIILGDSKKIEFVIPSPNVRIGNFILDWTILVGEETTMQSTNLKVSNTGKVMGDLINYYQSQLNSMKGDYDGEYINDAEKSLMSARELYQQGMYFEAMKYLDLVRESLSLAIQEGNIESNSSDGFQYFFDWLGSVNFTLLVLVFIFLVFFFGLFFLIKGTFKSFKSNSFKSSSNRGSSEGKREKDFRDREKEHSSDGSWEDKVRLLREKINMLEDGKKKDRLFEELGVSEGKFTVGLVNLGNAYCKKIAESLER
jgi:hypothetical protein